MVVCLSRSKRLGEFLRYKAIATYRVVEIRLGLIQFCQFKMKVSTDTDELVIREKILYLRYRLIPLLFQACDPHNLQMRFFHLFGITAKIDDLTIIIQRIVIQ